MDYLGKHFRSFDQYVMWMYCCEDHKSREMILKTRQHVAIKKLMDGVVRKPSCKKLQLHIGNAIKKLRPTVFSRHILDEYVGIYDFIGNIYDKICMPDVLTLERYPIVQTPVDKEIKFENECVKKTEVNVESNKDPEIPISKNDVNEIDNFVEDCRSEIQDLLFGLKVVYEYAGEVADVVINTINLTQVDNTVYIPIVANDEKEFLDKFADLVKLFVKKSVIIIVDKNNESVIKSALNL